MTIKRSDLSHVEAHWQINVCVVIMYTDDFFSPGGLIPVLLSVLQGKWVWSCKLPELILHSENCFCQIPTLKHCVIKLLQDTNIYHINHLNV